MANKLQSYFPLIPTENQVLKQIYSIKSCFAYFCPGRTNSRRNFSTSVPV